MNPLKLIAGGSFNKAILGGIAGGTVSTEPHVQAIVNWVATGAANGLGKLSALAGMPMPEEVNGAFVWLLNGALVGAVVYFFKNHDPAPAAASDSVSRT